MTIVSVYWFKQRFFTLCLKVFKLFVFLMGSGRLLQKEGPTYDKVFCPVLVLRKGCLSLIKLFLVSILQCGTFKDFIQIKRTVVNEKL